MVGLPGSTLYRWQKRVAERGLGSGGWRPTAEGLKGQELKQIIGQIAMRIY